MNRVQKKCLLASTGMHGLLLGVVLFGSAFFTAKDKVENLPAVQIITLDARLTDGVTAGGGKPNSRPAPPAAAPSPVPAPPKAQPVPPTPPKQEKQEKQEKVSKPEPSKPKVVEVAEKRPKDDQGLEPVVKPVKKKKEIEVDPTKLVVRKGEDAKETKRRAEAAREKARQEQEAREEREYAAAQYKAQQANAARFKGALNNLQQGLSTGTDIEPVGPGGTAYLDYSQFVKKVYDEAWLAPSDGADENATVKVSVTIARNGKVMSASITRRSGNVVLDNSIDRVLKRVGFVAPFPDGTQDAQRTFTINFNLKSKRLLG